VSHKYFNGLSEWRYSASEDIPARVFLLVSAQRVKTTRQNHQAEDDIILLKRKQIVK